SHGVEQTRRLGLCLGRLAESGDLILLEGDFGSGKTTFAQGVASGLGLDNRYVNSPTFTLINEYTGGRLPLAHIDLYRLEGEEQIATLGLDDYLDSRGVTVIEWPQEAATWLPPEKLLVRMAYLDEYKRTMRFYAYGERYTSLLEAFRRDAYGS
ncbi:MAG: tRNA (adenosine(37)-N6)-threonylcarbamoyltransferase complex ATPase subunit type 1 TsaE, partial [Chloroflexota bacterium]|nr:tRNA (adenosine(37)-N6)-threonylcarbamoyltransferase complex ATPase subunit type 1 TsaE [Chloroflexota bacterium]